MKSEDMFVKMAVDGWLGQIKAFNGTLGKLSDEQLMGEIAPGKNRGVYLLGHLTAVHDQMLPLLRFEGALYPDLKPIFIDAPDKTIASIPSMQKLREQWAAVNDKLLGHYNALPAAEWFTRHANVSEEDFAKEPHRNRLNVVMGRTNHLSYHRGQLVLL
jgi:hypothetical protein